jgi:hypothetical protein
MADSEKKGNGVIKGFRIHRSTLNAIKDPIKRAVAEKFISDGTWVLIEDDEP